MRGAPTGLRAKYSTRRDCTPCFITTARVTWRRRTNRDAAGFDKPGAPGTGIRCRTLRARSGQRRYRPRRRAQSLQRADLVHPFEGPGAEHRSPQPRGGVGLFHGDAERPLPRAGQRGAWTSPACCAGLPCATTRDMCWWSRTFCRGWERRRKARHAAGSIYGPLKGIFLRTATNVVSQKFVEEQPQILRLRLAERSAKLRSG